jgi:PKD repeat protein
MKESKTNTTVIKTFRRSLIPTVFTAACLLTPFPCFATDFKGTLDRVSITDAENNNIPPTSSFTYSTDGHNVTFDASGSVDSDGSITEYKWDFGDGNTGSGKIVEHTYLATDNTPVTLTTIDNGNGISLLQTSILWIPKGTRFYWDMEVLPEDSIVSNIGDVLISKPSNSGKVIAGVSGYGFKQTDTWQTYTTPATTLPTDKGRISVWIKHQFSSEDRNTSYRYFFRTTNIGQANTLYAYAYKNYIFFYLYDDSGASRRVFSQTSWGTDHWYQYEFSWDSMAGKVSISRDGSNLQEAASTPWNTKLPDYNNQDFHIGHKFPLGSFDDFFVFN